MVRVSVLIIVFLFSCFALHAEGSDQKDNVLSARRALKEAKKNQKACDSLAFPSSLSNSRCFSIYPDETSTWGRGFSDGLAKVTIHGKVGFISTTGQLVIPANFNDAGSFNEDLAPVETKNGKWGFINRKGRSVIPARFDWAVTFNEGLALIQIGELWGFIDSNGSVVIKPQFNEAESFSEGFAAVGWYDKDLEWATATPRKGKWVQRFIDKNGAWAIAASFDGVDHGFDGGMAIVSKNLGYSEKYKGMISESIVIDRSGRELWKLNSDSTYWFSDNTIIVEIKREPNGKSLYNFKDRKGMLLCSSNYEDPSGYSEGVSAVRIGGKYGFINKNCEFVISPQFSSASGFSDGLASVTDESGRKGVIDKTGKWLFETKFDWVGPFSNGFALVLDGAKSGYIDRNGSVLWRPTN